MSYLIPFSKSVLLGPTASALLVFATAPAVTPLIAVSVLTALKLKKPTDQKNGSLRLKWFGGNHTLFLTSGLNFLAFHACDSISRQ
jgi:hypothetical protein